MDRKNPKQILIAPLDWGLGHTTRCIPLIGYIRQQGHHIIVAGNEWQCNYIAKSFPGIETIHINGYDVNYGKRGFTFSIFSQVPKLLKAIRYEHAWIQELAGKRQIDGILSDNRYGLFHTSIPSVIITHQLLVRTGAGAVADNLLQTLHYKYLQRFGQCWVADVPGTPNLSGKLAHPIVLPANTKYIGLLSQIAQAHTSQEHLLVLLSGPEPQRTILSDILWEQSAAYKGKMVFVEGSDIAPRQANASPLNGDRNGVYYTRITGELLQSVIEKASMVICRSGYSTLMDLAVLGKKAILVPTPGQTEQEYLAKHLHKEGIFLRATQKRFNLPQALNNAQLFPFKPLQLDGAHELYKIVVNDWLTHI